MAAWKEQRALLEANARPQMTSEFAVALRAALARLDAAERAVTESCAFDLAGDRISWDDLTDYLALCKEQEPEKP